MNHYHNINVLEQSHNIDLHKYFDLHPTEHNKWILLNENQETTLDISSLHLTFLEVGSSEFNDKLHLPIGRIRIEAKTWNSVAHTGTQLYTVAHKLHVVEQSLENLENIDMDDLCVMEDVMETMTEVKRIEENLRKDIQEVQKLQRDVATSLRYQMRSMQQTLFAIKKRIESSTPSQSPSLSLSTAAAATTTATLAAASYYSSTQN